VTIGSKAILAAVGLAAAGALALAPIDAVRAAPTPARAAADPDGPHGSAIGNMDCGDCHTTDGWKLDELAASGGGFDHAVTGFPLRGQHAVTSCSQCHTGAQRLSQACESCHRDPHARRLGDSCAECHSAAAWTDTQTLARHRRSRMPLTGRHALIECAACHRRQDPRGFAATPTDCYACHQADYRRDIHPDHDGDPLDPGKAAFARQCGRCHSTIAFSPAVAVPGALARVISTRHDARFVISRGAHRGATCADCHPSTARPRVVTCLGCHTRGTLVGQHRRERLELATASCLRCHPGGRAR
jgi:hypothetical protein